MTFVCLACQEDLAQSVFWVFSICSNFFNLILQPMKFLNSHLFKGLEILIFIHSFPPLNVSVQACPDFYYKWRKKKNTDHMRRVFLQHHSSNFRCTGWEQLQSADSWWSCLDIREEGVCCFKCIIKPLFRHQEAGMDGSSPGKWETVMLL